MVRTIHQEVTMQSFRRLLLGGALAMAASSLPFVMPASAKADNDTAPTCHVSLTGTVTAVQSAREFSLQAANARVGNIHVYTSGARVNSNGLTLRPGVYAGVYGCYGDDRRMFNASQVTLAASAAAYRDTASTDRDAGRDNLASADIDNCHVSMFGTISSLRGPKAFVLTPVRSSLGSVYVDHTSARINANGLAVRPGVFAGLYGCVEQDGRVFKPDEVTLATSASAYAGTNREATLVGTIDEVHAGWIGVRTRYNGHIHVYTSQSGLRSGERVRIRGPYNPLTGVVNTASVAVI
jgi:hypothetical protein